MTMVEGASATTILVVPSAWMLALVMPSVTALLEVITPFSIVKLNSVVTAVKPFGAAVSLSVYAPSLRPMNLMSLPVNA